MFHLQMFHLQRPVRDLSSCPTSSAAGSPADVRPQVAFISGRSTRQLLRVRQESDRSRSRVRIGKISPQLRSEEKTPLHVRIVSRPSQSAGVWTLTVSPLLLILPLPSADGLSSAASGDGRTLEEELSAFRDALVAELAAPTTTAANAADDAEAVQPATKRPRLRLPFDRDGHLDRQLVAGAVQRPDVPLKRVEDIEISDATDVLQQLSARTPASSPSPRQVRCCPLSHSEGVGGCDRN